MAAARPSAHNAEFRVFILVLRRLRPFFVVPRARLRVRRESPPAAGLGEWQTACRGREKIQEKGTNVVSACDPEPISTAVRLFTGQKTPIVSRSGLKSRALGLQRA